MTIEEAIEMDLRSLETSVYSNNTFHEILNKIQKAVDDLSLNAYRHNHFVVPSYQCCEYESSHLEKYGSGREKK